MLNSNFSQKKTFYAYHPSHLLWLIIFLVSFFFQLFNLNDVLAYQRTAITAGRYWLLLTGHLVHLNWSHWMMNIAGLAIVAFFFSPYASFKQWLTVGLVSICFINIGLWWWLTHIMVYVGLSGVLHGFFLYGALREIKFYPLSGYILTTVLLAKLGWEAFNGSLPGSQAMVGGNVLTQAHLLGAIGGICVWFFSLPFFTHFSKEKIKPKLN
jgi:rhomboid family GlyGly-CTERM serine protease